MTVGARIAQKRKELGLSQEALGEKLCVSRQAIYKWESDTTLPEIEKLVALAKLFEVPVGWLLGVEEEAEVPKEDGELSETQIKMVDEIVSRYLAAQPKPKKPRSCKSTGSRLLLWHFCGCTAPLVQFLQIIATIFVPFVNSFLRAVGCIIIWI